MYIVDQKKLYNIKITIDDINVVIKNFFVNFIRHLKFFRKQFISSFIILFI